MPPNYRDWEGQGVKLDVRTVHASQTSTKATRSTQRSDSGVQSRGERANECEIGNGLDPLQNLEPGISPSQLKAYIIHELDVGLPQRQSTNVNADGDGDGPDLGRRRTSPR